MNTCKKWITSLAAIALAAATTAAAAAEGGTGTQTPSAGATNAAGDAASKLAGADRRFVMQAATGGMAEVELGRLAQQQASSEQVRQFGARMVEDHGKANEELKQLAQSKGIGLPSGIGNAHRSDMNKLKQLSGADFDRQYMDHMVADHRKTVADFEKAAQSARDSDVRAFAAKTLPTLQEHMRQAEAIQRSVVSASR